MKAEKVISDFIRGKLQDVELIYDWKDPNMEKFPISGYKLTGQTSYEKNRNLRSTLNKAIRQDLNISPLCQTWYVKYWGGVLGNREETLDEYVRMTNDQLVGLGKKGIASWSKILSVRDQSKYAIYDARVALSLNSIQKIMNVEDAILFPQLASRNKSFVLGAQTKINNSEIFKSKKSNSNFYSVYLEILRESVKNKNPYDIQDAEMILFASAEELSKIWSS